MMQSKLARTLKATEDMLAQLRELAAAHQRFPDEPDSGSVIRFTKRFSSGGKGYSYAALRVGPRWYLTGARSSSSGRPGNWMPFDELVEFIGDGKACVSTGWADVPTMNPEVPVAIDEDLLARLAGTLTDNDGKNIDDVARNLLGVVQEWSAEKAPEGARFRGDRIYPDDI